MPSGTMKRPSSKTSESKKSSGVTNTKRREIPGALAAPKKDAKSRGKTEEEPITRTQRKVVADEEIVRGLKRYAADTGRKLNDVYDEGVVAFFEEREQQLKAGELDPRVFYTAPLDAPEQPNEKFNVNLREEYLDKADRIAKEDSVSITRVLYNSLLRLVKKRNYIP